jgi:hypothetical protein
MNSIPILLAIVSVLVLGVVSYRSRLTLGPSQDTAQLIVRIGVSVIVLCAGLYVILDDNYLADDKKWGYGIVGTVVGYWLKS